MAEPVDSNGVHRSVLLTALHDSELRGKEDEVNQAVPSRILQFFSIDLDILYHFVQYYTISTILSNLMQINVYNAIDAIFANNYNIKKLVSFIPKDIRKDHAMTTQWLRVEDVAKELNVHPETVRIWIRERELNAVAFKRAYRIRRADLDDFIRRHETMGDHPSEHK